MDFNYTKIKLGNWLYRHAFPLYRFSYYRFKKKNDRDEIALLSKLVKPGMVVYDIGANIGFYAEILARLCNRQGKVICFEPDQTNYSHLRNAVGGRGNVRLFQAAVSEKHETLKIYRSRLLNVDHRTYPVNNAESVEEVQAVSIDRLISSGEIPAPDIVKIDIQGYELAAFKGMTRLLESARRLIIIAEFWPHGFRRAGTSAVEFFDFLEKIGYGFRVIEGSSLRTLKRSEVEKHNDEVFEYSFNVLITKE